MSKYFVDGRIVRVSEGQVVLDHIPVETYMVSYNQLTGITLEMATPFTVPDRLYGSVEKTAKRVLKTYKARGCNTGVLLSGEKGSGKTMLARELSIEAARQGIATLIVNSPLDAAAFGKLLSDIHDPCMVLFDEFEKVFSEGQTQQPFLTLLDGTFQCNKLFVLTVNDSWRLNEYLLNRPGRVFYHFKYGPVEEGVILQFCEDNLQRKEWGSDVVALSKLSPNFNFDMMKALVEECNIHDEAPSQVYKMLNLSILDQHQNYSYVMAKGERKCMGSTILSLRSSFSLEWDDNVSDDEEENEDPEVVFLPEDCQKYDKIRQTFVYMTADGVALELKVHKPKPFEFDAF